METSFPHPLYLCSSIFFCKFQWGPPLNLLNSSSAVKRSSYAVNVASPFPMYLVFARTNINHRPSPRHSQTRLPFFFFYTSSAHSVMLICPTIIHSLNKSCINASIIFNYAFPHVSLKSTRLRFFSLSLDPWVSFIFYFLQSRKLVSEFSNWPNQMSPQVELVCFSVKNIQPFL